MAKWGPAMEAAGVGMGDFTVEEFEIDTLLLGSGDRTAVSCGGQLLDGQLFYVDGSEPSRA